MGGSGQFVFSCGVAVATVTAAVVSGERLGSEQIAAAIRAGQSGRVDELRATCTAGPAASDPALPVSEQVRRDGRYTVTFSGSGGRIAVLAADAGRRGDRFTVEDVPPDLREQSIFVFANPIRPTVADGVVSAPSPIDRIAIRAATEPAAQVTPDGVDWEGVEWRNPLGGFLESNRATASFGWEAVRDLPAGDLEVVITAEAGERRCTIPGTARERILRGGSPSPLGPARGRASPGR